MFGFLKRRAFLLILGFLLLAIFIWFAGPYFGFGSYHPLEPELARLITIGLIVGVWVVSVLIKRLRASLASEKLVAAVLKQAPAEEPPSAEAIKLRERFEEAVATLKQEERTGHSLYDLPWYVFIGAPGSGKTTALLNSGLKFPLEKRLGRGELRGVGGTRNCDWFFTDEAVFLDTAGRYTTQDSDTASDSAAWKEFLTLLRKYRQRRPVNGIILTISAQDLLVQAEATREGQAEAVRRRLLELNKDLQIDLPVYLMVTKCDLIAGFTEYFDDLAPEARTQVWGVTFPYEQTLKGEAAQLFPSEFDELMGRLNARLFGRLEDDRDIRRRTKMFAFPQQVAALRDLLAQFVGEVFASTRFDQPIRLRGVYFTSGTQEGTPIDRLLGSIGRSFGVAPEAVAPTGRGKAYFVERLLKEVLIGESGLAGVNRRLERKKAALQLGAYAALAVVTLFAVIAWSVSYGRNRAYVGEVDAEVTRLRDVPTVRSDAPLDKLLPRLDAIRAVVDTADRYRNETPWAMRWGLFQGTSVGNSARDAYLRELDGLVLPLFAARVKQRLVEYAAEPEKLYEYLRAYVMLGDPKRLNKKQLQDLAELELTTGGGTSDQGAELLKHFQSLLDFSETLRPIAIDATLVAQGRATIQRASIPQIIYSGVKRTYANDEARAVRLDVAAGVGVDQVLRRKSGASVSAPLPSLYGRAVFKEVAERRMELVKQFADEKWVWGDAGSSTSTPATLATELIQVYEQDYIAAWDRLLGDFELVTFPTVRQTADALGVLAAPTSPLKGLLSAVVDNTSLVETPDKGKSDSILGAAATFAKGKANEALNKGKAAIGLSTTIPGAQVKAHFQKIHDLMAGPPENAPIDRILGQIRQIQQQLQSLGAGVGESDPSDVFNNPTFRGQLSALEQDASALTPLVGALVSQIGSKARSAVTSSTENELLTRYQQQVLKFCTQTLAGRYPFDATSTEDVQLMDFGTLFARNGKFDKFFEDNFQNYVDTDESPWTWRQGSPTSSPALLAQFEMARRIRDGFFPVSGQGPQVNFTLTLKNADGANRRFILQIDGQTFDDRRSMPNSPAVWPGSRPMAVVTFEDDRAGTWPPTYKFDDIWAWFRLLDAARPQRVPPLRLVLNIKQASFQGLATIEATTIRNPLVTQDWRRFSCGS